MPFSPKTQTTAPPKILVVEDHPVNRQVLLQILGTLGYRADVATNGREALERSATTQYDLILLDCQMPEMDGYDATRQIRQRERVAASAGYAADPVIIIAVTAHAMKGDRERCLQSGMDDYLTKPVDPDDLHEVLNRWLSLRGHPMRPSVSAGTKSLETASTAGSTADSRPPIDIKRLQKLTFGDHNKMQEILELYLTHSRDLMRDLDSAFQHSSLSKIQFVAHKLAGMSANCGVSLVVIPFRELEKAAAEKRVDDLDAHAAEGRRQLQIAWEYIERFRCQPP